MADNLSDKKVALVTGSSNGIGRLSIETLGRDGHTVYASMRDVNGRNANVRKELEELSRGEKLDIRVIELDVTDDGSVERAVAEVIADSGQIDVLVNNAGVMNVGITEAFTLDQVKHEFDVNFYGAVRTNRAVLPHMRHRKEGLLIHVSSLAGRAVFPFFGIYCASKFALEAMAESYRYELSDYGVDSVIVEPGPFPSGLIAGSPSPDDHARLSEYGSLAERPGSILASFDDLFKSENAPATQDVADVISGLISTPAGSRPLRTVVGLDFGVREINKSVAPLQTALLDTLGLEKLKGVNGPLGNG